MTGSAEGLATTLVEGVAYKSPSRFGSPSADDREVLDRFVPSRISSNLDNAFARCGQHVDEDDRCGSYGDTDVSRPGIATDNARIFSSKRHQITPTSYSSKLHNQMVRAEMLGENDFSLSSLLDLSASSFHTTADSLNSSRSLDQSSDMTDLSYQSPARHQSFSSGKSVLRFRSHRKSSSSSSSTSRDDVTSQYGSLWSAFESSSAGSSSSVAPPRSRCLKPFKVLDAPRIHDDFYLNLVEWGPTNVVAVALSNAVFLWSASTSKVTKLMETSLNGLATSVSWARDGKM